MNWKIFIWRKGPKTYPTCVQACGSFGIDFSHLARCWRNVCNNLKMTTYSQISLISCPYPRHINWINVKERILLSVNLLAKNANWSKLTKADLCGHWIPVDFHFRWSPYLQCRHLTHALNPWVAIHDCTPDCHQVSWSRMHGWSYNWT